MEGNIRSRKKRFISLASEGPISGDVLEDVVDWQLNHSYLTTEAEKPDIYFPNIHCSQRQSCDLVSDTEIAEDALMASSFIRTMHLSSHGCELPSATGSLLAWKWLADYAVCPQQLAANAWPTQGCESQNPLPQYEFAPWWDQAEVRLQLNPHPCLTSSICFLCSLKSFIENIPSISCLHKNPHFSI